MTVGSLRELLWYLALTSGWLAIILLGSGWYARRRFRAFLKFPLTEEVEHLTHVWEKRVSLWTAAGLTFSGLSIICLVSWLIAGMIP
ncbi:hypothetical protein [Microvirga tunisiensis]|uniref:Uncharacterized protein n=1 Tax=Microvirga tunisiensis TaxID=2108360 RepID=A0A5N7N8R1_9HYPH|nr:hypothetical protein [Microvirga tunisiensis]MPR13397.1 hypothetical protein [Microvirga tunisiensis]MPR31266.1 hypothetical protein [Microvirga tunisiensis]